MKIKSGFILREIADSYIVVPVAQRVVEFNGMINLSSSGALLWRLLEIGVEEDALVGALQQEYEVDRETARADVSEFVESIRRRNLIEE